MVEAVESNLASKAGQVSQISICYFIYLLLLVVVVCEQFREEADSFGPIQVPADKYWGAQTQRSLQNFKIGGERERMPVPVVRAFGLLKKSAARANLNFGLEERIANVVI